MLEKRFSLLGPGEYGAIVNWFHSDCAKLDELLVSYAKSGDEQLKKMVLGWDALTVDESLGKTLLASICVLCFQDC